MEEDYSQLRDDLSSEEQTLLRTVLHALDADIELYKSIRENGRITGFECVLVNKPATSKAADTGKLGKKILNNPGSRRLFNKLIELVETGKPWRDEHPDNPLSASSEHLNNHSYIKFNDGFLSVRKILSGKNAQGDIESKTGIAIDNSERRNTEQDFRKNKDLLQSVFDATTNGFSLLETIRDSDGDIIDFRYKLVNLTTERITKRQGLVGRIVSEVHKGFKKTGGLFDHLKNVVETGETGTVELYYDDEGFSNWYSITAVKLEDDVLVSFEDITEKKRADELRTAAELALHQQNATLENLKRIVDSTHDGIASLDRQGRINYWNPASELIYGYRADEVMGKKLEGLIVIEHRKPDLTKAMIQVYHHGSPILNMATQKRKKDGNIIDVIITIFPLKDETGDIVGSFLITKDVSEAKRSREKLREDAHFIGQIMDTTPDIIYIMDLNTHQIIYANRQVAADLGYTKQQIADLKNPIFDIMHPQDVPAMKEHLKKIKALANDDAILEIQFRLKNAKGGYNWFCDRNAVFKRNTRKIPVEKIGVCQDITARKVQEDQRRANQDIIQQSEQIVEMGSWEYDISNDEYKWSEGMYRIFGLDADIKIRPEVYLEFTPESEKQAAERIVSNILYNFAPFEETLQIVTTSGEKKVVKIKCVIQKDKNDGAVKVLGVDLDITHQVEAAEKIKELNRILTSKNRELETLNEELRTFNMVTASDYKQTLQILYTNLEYIARKEARNLGDSSRANIRRAQSAIQKMKLLTDDINTYLQLYELGINKSLLDPNAIIEKTVKDMESKIEQTTASFELATLPPLYADPLLFQHLLTSLIDNAIKFRKMISPLHVKIKYSKADEINAIAGALRDTPYIIISVSDNGVGFDEQHADKVFDLFYRAYDHGQYRGSGIGLAVCKKIMAMHEGFITADSTPGFGSTFYCYFPMSPPVERTI